MKLTGLGLTPRDFGFPYDSFRPGQLEIGEGLLNTQRKISILQCPTGFGKSLVVQLPGRILNQRTLVLTSTKTLQDQYGEDGLQVLYGRNNYICNRWPLVSAAEGVCRAGQSCSLMHGGCDYFDEKSNALDSNTAVLNYAYFLREANGPGQFSGYDYIVCDEGHSVPSEITRSFTVRLFMPFIRGLGGLIFPFGDSVENWIAWAIKYHKKLKDKVNGIRREKAQALFQLIVSTEILMAIKNPLDWMIESDYNNVTIRPIWPDSIADKYLWPHANKFIFSSASIDPFHTMSMLNKSMHDVELFSMNSDFPRYRRPVLAYPKHTVNSNSTWEDLENLVRDIDKIISMYPDSRGLIHTSSYELADTIYSLSKYQHKMIVHSTNNRSAKLALFESVRGIGQILVSPSMTEGIDLKYRLCDFQIVAKLSFQNLLDELWKARFKSNGKRAEQAYLSETINALVQAVGRGMRAADDTCDNWILDSEFQWLYNSNHTKFQEHFKEAVVYVNSL